MTVDRQAALDLRINHKLTYPEIAKIQGVSKQAIHQQIHHLIPTEQTAEYRVNRADILSHQQLRLLSQGLTNAKLKQIKPRDAIISFGILYDKERLERGQSTTITESLDDSAVTARLRGLIQQAVIKGKEKLSTVAQKAEIIECEVISGD